MHNALPMRYTFNVIVKCWENAELELRSIIQKKYHDLNEECITTLFYHELKFALHTSSQKKEIERAFLADLHQAFPRHHFSGNLETYSANLISDVILHNHQVEGVTGGDFGLTLTRPKISWDNRLKFARSEYQRGLLCQAKLKGSDGKWRELTSNQEKVIPDRMSFLALLRYSYLDPERHCLNPFDWQICKGVPADDIESLLKSNKLGISSAEIIKGLGNAQIGTDDQKIIKDYLRPHSRPYLHIRILWPPGKEPPGHFQVVPRVTPQLQQIRR